MVRVRVAPSPTGFPHIGTVWQALINYAFARKNNGRFIVRVEDTDQRRLVEGAEEALFEALDWFGLTPDESPIHGGDYGPYRQSERLELYKRYAEELVERGFAYHCFCSEERLAEVRQGQQECGQPPMYDRCCRELARDECQKRIASGEPCVIRMKVPADEEIVVNDLLRGEVKFDSNTVDDQVLLKSDGFPTYHLAVVVDDHLMEISRVVRGEEWLSSAPKHVLLYRYFGWEPPVFVHTPIIRNPGGSKLSKRQGHAAVSWYREQGYLPEALLNFLALLGWSHPEEKDVFSLEEFIRLFDLKDLNYTAPVFDLQKLDWMNGNYIRQLSVGELISKLKNQNSKISSIDDDYLEKIIPLVRERMKKLSEFEELTEFFFEEPEIDPELLVQKGKTAEEIKEVLSAVSGQLSAIDDWNSESLEALCRRFVEDSEHWNASKLFMTLRIAITGRKVSPPLFETTAVLGKEVTLRRIEKAAARR